jgi:hypothetical protein
MTKQDMVDIAALHESFYRNRRKLPACCSGWEQKLDRLMASARAAEADTMVIHVEKTGRSRGGLKRTSQS